MAISAAVVLVDLLVQPVHIHMWGRHLSSGLTGIAYTAAIAMCVTTFRWFRTAPNDHGQLKEPPQTTVRELRRRASHGASNTNAG